MHCFSILFFIRVLILCNSEKKSTDFEALNLKNVWSGRGRGKHELRLICVLQRSFQAGCQAVLKLVVKLL